MPMTRLPFMYAGCPPDGAWGAIGAGDVWHAIGTWTACACQLQRLKYSGRVGLKTLPIAENKELAALLLPHDRWIRSNTGRDA
jgi:hypothetical protein